ncbi:MAG TPA: cytochrome c3 family protein [Candidatus Binatia bacterium]|nr:cytochrome c3 family protein [Candidatus Binatia bacterium]
MRWRWGVLLAAPLAVATAGGSRRENVHRPGADCGVCHTAGRGALEQDPAGARGLVAPDLDARCTGCHDDEGPSHGTGIRPQRPVPDALPLSADGLITCATCHFVHGERDSFSYFERIDNSRGALCLTCHALSELQ